MSRLWEYVLQLEPGSLQQEVNFFDYGGQSLLAVELTQLIEQYFQVQLKAKDIYDHPTITELVRSMNHATSTSTTTATWRADARLDTTILPPATSAALSLNDARALFVTGSTGFLGAFLLAELLRTTAHHVKAHCLVRVPRGTPGDGLQRLRRTLQHYRLWDESFTDRLVPIIGDLGQPRFGLSPERFGELGATIDVLFHCGALVNYVYPYAMLKPSMVNGTQEILRLACTTVTKPLHYVSTNGIFPGGDPTPYLENDQIDAFAERLAGGYGAGKWVAEKLVWEAVSRELPVCLYRPGNIGHHSVSGAVNPNDFQWMIMQACKILRCAPAADTWRFEMTPVDFLVRSMVRFAQHPGHFGQVYNVVQANPTPANVIFELLREQGHLVDTVPLEQWQARLHAQAEEGSEPWLKVLAQSISDVEPYLSDTSRYDCARFDQAVAGYGMVRPETHRKYFGILLA